MSSNILRGKSTLGVIIARFQVPYLTESHKSTIRTVFDRHSRILFLLGTSYDVFSAKNPFTFEFRRQMLVQHINSTFNPNTFTTLPLYDNEDDNAAWVRSVDEHVGHLMMPFESAIIYGGRDSFIPYYKKDNGSHVTVELAQQDYNSGTDLRLLEGLEHPKYSIEVAKTILWTLRNIHV